MTERSDIHKYSFVIRHSSIPACPGISVSNSITANAQIVCSLIEPRETIRDGGKILLIIKM